LLTAGKESVRVTLEDGRTATGDLLIGADGIWSKVRKELVGASAPVYSGYTCYTGISDFTPPDLEIVGYRVFLGNGQVGAASVMEAVLVYYRLLLWLSAHRTSVHL
jgi:zeaxanthin epoxidase